MGVPTPPVELALFQLSQWAGHVDAFRDMLSAAEREQVAKSRKPLEALRFILARGILRTFLGERMGISPEAVQFTCDTCGKWHVVATPIQNATSAILNTVTPSLHFAQSGDWFLIAGDALGEDVGVFLQTAEATHEGFERAKHSLTLAETAAMSEFPEPIHPSLSSELYALKNAYLSVNPGTGLEVVDFSEVLLSGPPAVVAKSEMRKPFLTQKSGTGNQLWEVGVLATGSPILVALACRVHAEIVYSNSLASLVLEKFIRPSQEDMRPELSVLSR